MGKKAFVHLHLHSQYSMLDGFIRFNELAPMVKKFNMNSVALTDHGNLHGIIPFYEEMSRHGIKPIIGMEAYVAPGSRKEKKRESKVEGYAFHLLLLAVDNIGLKNLQKLSSCAFTEGFYYKPRIDKELLQQHSRGLIACSACLHGEIPYYLLRGDQKKAEEIAEFYLSLFGRDRFYLELMENGIEEQRIVNEGLLDLARRMNIKLVATADVHYLYREDASVHEVLLCIQTGNKLTDENRFRFKSQEFYFKSPEEMEAHFGHIERALANTLEIAEMCNVEIEFGKPHFPRFEVPGQLSLAEYLSQTAREGLKKRLDEMKEAGGKPDEKVYVDRLNHELEMINKLGFAEYFLIVADIVNFAKNNGIPVGPGRGSAAGSLVSYALRITDIDPIKYGLLFERFLNPDRVTLPDIDVDVCKERRNEVIEYVRKRYGEDHVAFVGTFQTMRAKQALRDVCRAYGVSTGDTEKIAKMIPERVKSLKEALEMSGPLKELYRKDKKMREMVDVAMRIEGVVRQAGTHPGGLVITPEPVIESLPVFAGKGNVPTTQFDKDVVDRLGYVKLDLLALDTVTAIYETVELVKKNRGKDVNIKDIPLDDAATYKMLSEGQTQGVFQLSNPGMTEVVRRLKPQKLSDLIATVALFRPGPLETGMVDDFIQRRHGRKRITYELPALKSVLEETYGVIVYQEQVMEIARVIAGFTMSEADTLRYAMGKKVREKMEEL